MPFSSAMQLYIEARNKPRKIGDLLQEDLFQVESDKICTYKKKSDELVSLVKAEAITKFSNGNPNYESDDLELYSVWRNMSGKFDVRDILPRGESLDQALKIDMSKTDSWKQPIVNQVYPSTKMQVLLINVKSTPDQDFAESVNMFKNRTQMQRNLYINSPLLAFSVENIKIPRVNFQEMINAKKNKEKFVSFKFKASADDLIEVPAIFTVSDGVNLRLEFKLPWVCKPNVQEKDGYYDVSYDLCDIRKSILDYWRSLPILFSVDAHDQIYCLLRFLQDLYGIDLDLAVMDLKALAVTAGLRMDEMNLLTLCIVTSGNIFPIGLENFDQRWADEISDQPKSMQEYLYNKLHHVSYIYRVLMGLILRGCFPDPDICLTATEMTQTSFVSWFCDFVGTALSTTNVDVTRLMGFTRQEMVYELNPDSILIQYLSDLIIEVPVAQCGGARFLHSNRKRFFGQYDTIKKIKLPMSKEEKPNQTKDLYIDESTLMYDRELSIMDQRNGYPVSKFGLQPNPQFKDRIYDIDVEHDDITKFVPMRDRRMLPALEEWGRLNHHLLPRLFQRLRSVPTNTFSNFWIPRIRVYDKFRLIVLRVLDVKESVEVLDRVIFMKRSNVQKQYNDIEEKRTNDYQGNQSGKVTARVLVNQRQRVDLLNHEVHYAGTADRVGVDRNVHDVVPGDHVRRNKKWKHKRERRKARKLNGRDDVLSDKQFNNEKNLRAISNHGIEIDAPLRRPVSESRTVRFLDEDNSNQPATSKHGYNETQRSVSSRDLDSSRERHSSGYSSSYDSGPSGEYYHRPDLDYGDRKRPRSSNDLRNRLERTGDLRDTVERRMVFSKKPRDDGHRRY